MLEAVQLDFDENNIRELKIDGGMTRNRLFNQLQADILGKVVICPSHSEFSGWGAAIAAGIGLGVIDKDEYKRRKLPEFTTFNPNSNGEERRKRLAQWKKAVERARGWINTKVE